MIRNLKKIKDGNRDGLVTKNLVPGESVYGEELIEIEGEEYRLWNPLRSKLATAILLGTKALPELYQKKIIYLGASHGTTVSHVSDLVGAEGIIFAVEFSSRAAREFVAKCSNRENIIPIIEDARNYLKYRGIFGHVDIVYCDIAQPDQTNIAISNCKAYINTGGILILVVKARSIDVAVDPNTVFHEEEAIIAGSDFEILEKIDLSPFHKAHLLIIAKYLGR
ncbi:MAG: fibrillarin-like rRNA/tRNA 2'-O-methyltransferase [Nitrososphaerales archaeon]